MRDYLVFQLYGPLAAWGDIAVGETRPSVLTPTKSAVLGLVAAAVGVKRPGTARDESEGQACEAAHARLVEGYGMAVKVEASGLPLSDYHSVQVPSSGKGRNRMVFPSRRDEVTWVPRVELNTILSRRQYRQDAYSVVALWAREKAPYPLKTLCGHLLTPRFVLYLGRKACPPALPLNPHVVPAESIEDALASVTLSKAIFALWDDDTGRRMIEKFPAGASWLLWDDDAQTRIPGGPAETITRRDVPLSRRRWQFAVRTEHRAALGEGGRP